MHIIANLQLLASTPIEELSVDGPRLRPIRPGESVDSEKFERVIRDTFHHAATREDPLHRFWTKEPGSGHIYVSPGFLAERLGIGLPINLPKQKEERDLVTLVINKKEFVVERNTLAAETSSLILRNLLTAQGFTEASSNRIQIELPPHLKLDEDSMQQAITALFDGRLPHHQDINSYIYLALFFSYFQANDLFKASLRKIISFKPSLFQWIELLRFPDELVDDMIKELHAHSAEQLLQAIKALSIEGVREHLDPTATAVTMTAVTTTGVTTTDLIEEITANGSTVNIRRFVIALANRIALSYSMDIPMTQTLLNYFGVDIGLLRSVHLSRHNRELIAQVAQRCPNIQALIIDCEGVLDLDAFLSEVLQHWPQLLKLRLFRPKDDALKCLTLVPHLEELTIQIGHDLAPNAFEHLVHVPNLNRLEAYLCNQLEEKALENLVHVSNLTILKLLFCRSLKKDALNNLVHVRNLEVLDIAGCNQLEEKALENLVHVPNLEILSIKECNQFAEHALANLVFAAKLLELYMFRCTGLGKNLLENLVHLPNLELLDIEGCNQLEEKALENLVHAPNLRLLNVADCRKLEAGALRNVVYTPSLERVDTTNTNCDAQYIPPNLADKIIVIQRVRP